MKCIKVYPEMRNDARLRALKGAQRWVWFRLLCFAGEQPERGTINAPSERILAIEVADGDVGLMNETLSALSSLRCIEVRLDGDGSSDAFQVRFIAFHECFSVSRHTNLSTPRVRKYREAKRLREMKHETALKQNETRVSPPPSLPPVPPLVSPSYSPSLSPPGINKSAQIAQAHAREGGNPESTPPARVTASPISRPNPETPPAPGGAPPRTPDEMLEILRAGQVVEPDDGAHSPTPDQAESTFRLVWRLFGPGAGPPLAVAYWQRQRCHSDVAWRSAIQEAARRKPNLSSFNYVETIATNHPEGIRPPTTGGQTRQSEVGLGPESPRNKPRATPGQIRRMEEAERERREANLARERERGPWPEGVGLPGLDAVRQLLRAPRGAGVTR